MFPSFIHLNLKCGRVNAECGKRIRRAHYRPRERFAIVVMIRTNSSASPSKSATRILGTNPHSATSRNQYSTSRASDCAISIRRVNSFFDDAACASSTLAPTLLPARITCRPITYPATERGKAFISRTILAANRNERSVMSRTGLVIQHSQFTIPHFAVRRANSPRRRCPAIPS